MPGRTELLAQNMESVRDQTVRVDSHLIIADDGSLGPIEKYNRAFRSVTTSWISILDDDNWWFHDHVETIQPFFDQADVIYTKDAGHTRPCQDLSARSQAEIVDLFGRTNVLDQSCAIRSEMFQRVGGFSTDHAPREMDQDLWYRIAQAGGRFHAIQKETWFYTAR